MRRNIKGLRDANSCAERDLPEGLYLVKVRRVRFQFDPRRPFYTLTFVVTAPHRFSGMQFSSRLYCKPKALWKLHWFLRDFGYNTDSLERDELDEHEIVGLQGVAKLNYIILSGASWTRLDGFAPAASWTELSPDTLDNPQVA